MKNKNQRCAENIFQANRNIFGGTRKPDFFLVPGCLFLWRRRTFLAMLNFLSYSKGSLPKGFERALFCDLKINLRWERCDFSLLILTLPLKDTDLHLAFPQNPINVSTRFFVPEDSCRSPQRETNHHLSSVIDHSMSDVKTSTLFEGLLNNQSNTSGILAPFKDSPLDVSFLLFNDSIRQMNRDQLLP